MDKVIQTNFPQKSHTSEDIKSTYRSKKLLDPDEREYRNPERLSRESSFGGNFVPAVICQFQKRKLNS